jgi:hypothetical protein
MQATFPRPPGYTQVFPAALISKAISQLRNMEFRIKKFHVPGHPLDKISSIR